MAQLQSGSEGLLLSGDVSLADVSALSQLPEVAGDSVAFSLVDVTSADSAIAALLLAWRRQMDARGISMVVTGCPDSVRSLLNLYDLDALFGL